MAKAYRRKAFQQLSFLNKLLGLANSSDANHCQDALISGALLVLERAFVFYILDLMTAKVKATGYEPHASLSLGVVAKQYLEAHSLPQQNELLTLVNEPASWVNDLIRQLEFAASPTSNSIQSVFFESDLSAAEPKRSGIIASNNSEMAAVTLQDVAYWRDALIDVINRQQAEQEEF